MMRAAMPAVLLYRFGPLLLCLHALFAMALLGASVHHAIVAILAMGGRLRPRLSRIYALLSLCAYVAALATGALLYPRYRYFVRGLYLDRYAPWAANLFDMKENLATLGLPLCVGALVLSLDLPRHQGEEGRPVRLLYGILALLTAAITLFNVVAGLLCTGVRGA